MLLFALAVFLIGSLLSGLSREMWQLVAFRALQGLGAGALFPIALAVIGDMFSPAERGKYQGFVGAVFGLASLIGPAIGGVITDTVGWQWVFFVNLPIGAVVFAVIWRTLPRARPGDASTRIDYLGATVLVAALVPILIGLTNKQSGSWGDLTVGGLIAAGLAITALFVWIEARTGDPIVPIELFRNRSFTLSVIAMFMASMAFFAPVVFLPRWFQVVGGASATQSGYQILALLGGLIISAIVSGQIVARTGRFKPLALGAGALLAIGLFLLSNLRADLCRCCGSGCSSPGSAWDRSFRSSRSSCRTRSHRGRSAPRPAASRSSSRSAEALASRRRERCSAPGSSRSCPGSLPRQRSPRRSPRLFGARASA